MTGVFAAEIVMRACFRTLSLAILCLQLVFFAVPSYAKSAYDVEAELALEDVHSLTRRILDLELEILRHNTFFRIETNDQSKFRSIRQFLYNLSASSVSLGSSTTIMSHRWSTDKPNNDVLEAGAIGLVVGQAIIQAGIVTEKLVDLARERRAWKKGYSPKQVTVRVSELKDQLDELLARRVSTLSSLKNVSPGTLKILTDETRVLVQLRNLVLMEFARFYADQSKRRTSRNVSYINGLVATAAGGYGGSLIGLLGVTRQKPSYTVPAGIGFIASSAAVLVSPYVNRFFANRAKDRGMAEARAALGELSMGSMETLDTDLNALSMAVKTAKPGERPFHIQERLSVYSSEFEILRQQLLRESSGMSEGKRLFRRRVLANGVIAGSKMAWGVMLITAGAGLSNNGVAFNKRVAEAATVYTVGQGAWVADSLSSGTTPKSLKFTVGGQISFELEKLEKRYERLKELEELVVDSK